jgi:hypothetical protein
MGSSKEQYEIITHNGVQGYFVPLSSGKIEYPELFERFWDAYHPDRRLGKKSTFFAWKKMSMEDAIALPEATAAYTAHIKLFSSPRYMKHPMRFISTGDYFDWFGKKNDGALVETLEYWDSTFKSVYGFSPAWKEEDRTMAITDTMSIGNNDMRDKMWDFFIGDKVAVIEARKKLGPYYKTFHSLLYTHLSGQTRRKEQCKYCGGIGRHHDTCPVIQQIKMKRKIEMEEFQKAKEADFDLQGAFQSEINKRGES